ALLRAPRPLGARAPGTGLPRGARPPARRHHLGAEGGSGAHRGKTHAARAADDDDPLAFHGVHDGTSSTALPRTLRPRSAAAASAAFSHGPRHPIWGSSSPAA